MPPSSRIDLFDWSDEDGARIPPDPSGNRQMPEIATDPGGPALAPVSIAMTSHTPTLLDPFEVAGGAGPRARMPSFVDQATEWFDRASLPLFELVSRVVEEITESPPWTPEPVDRRWRARGWTDE
jgi:hypothetical protein